MKKIVLLTILGLICANLSAQTNNFFVEDGKIYWQKIYELDADIESLLTNSGKFENIKFMDNTFSASIKSARVDPNGRGSMEIPIYIRDKNMVGFVRIQQKESRYRVTVEQIKFIAVADGPFDTQGEETTLELYALKKNGSLGSYFIKTASLILDEYLTSIFLPVKELGDNW